MRNFVKSLVAGLIAVATSIPGTAVSAASVGCDGWMMMPLRNAGFEDPAGVAPVPGWSAEGADRIGVDRAIGWSHSGANDAFIEVSAAGRWNAITQRVAIGRGYHYRLHGFARTSDNVTGAYFGVRPGTSTSPYSELHFGPLAGGFYHEMVVDIYNYSLVDVTVFIGYWSPSGASWLVVDDVWFEQLECLLA